MVMICLCSVGGHDGVGQDRCSGGLPRCGGGESGGMGQGRGGLFHCGVEEPLGDGGALGGLDWGSDGLPR